jgi:hypothetical protein
MAVQSIVTIALVVSFLLPSTHSVLACEPAGQKVQSHRLVTLPQKNFSTAATGVLVERAAVEATACFVVAGAGLVVEGTGVLVVGAAVEAIPATGVLVVGAAVEVTACLVVVRGVGVLLDVAITVFPSLPNLYTDIN